MRQLVQTGVAWLHGSEDGTTMQLQSNGEMFRATLAKHPPVLDSSELGYDPRMAVIMEVLQDAVPKSLQGLSAQSQIRIKDVESGIIYRVVYRENNGADFTTEFTLVQNP